MSESDIEIMSMDELLDNYISFPLHTKRLARKLILEIMDRQHILLVFNGSLSARKDGKRLKISYSSPSEFFYDIPNEEPEITKAGYNINGGDKV